MDKRWLSVLGVLLLMATAGCRNLARPNFACPGRIERQQARAQQFDPYPENEPGPKIEGGRPMEYAIPRDEVVRIRPPLEPHRARQDPWNLGR